MRKLFFVFLLALIIPFNSFTQSTWNGIGLPFDFTPSYGAIYSTVTDANGNLYVAGTFTSIGGTPCASIAKWDGHEWVSLGSGVTGVIYCMAFNSSGDLFVGGQISSLGGSPVRGVAKWNGSTWTALNTIDIGGGVYSMTFDPSGKLYVGGTFSSMGGVAVNKLAKWDGTSWSAVGAWVTYPTKVAALASDNAGHLYVGGTGPYLQFWDGLSWSVLAGPNGPVTGLSMGANGHLYAVGNFLMAGTTTVNNIAEWDGSSWSPIAAGSAIALKSIITDAADNIYVSQATAPFAVLRWDGSTWTDLGSSAGIINSLASYNYDIYAAGQTDSIAGRAMDKVAHWNGLSWLSFSNGANREILCIAAAPDGSYYAGGRFTSIGGVQANHIARYDGTSWSPLGAGTNNYVYSVAVDKNGLLYAGGSFTMAGTVPVNSVARWNGTAWDSLAGGVGGAVYALATDSSANIIVAGRFNLASGVPANNVAKWDGNSFSALGDGVNEFVSAALVTPDQHLFLAGGFTQADSVPNTNAVAEWDGSSWNSLGAGVAAPGFLRALANDKDGNIFIGGTFDSVGGILSPNIAMWDGSNWHSRSLPGPGTPVVWSIATDTAGNCYAGGHKLFLSGASDQLVKWSAGSWSSFATAPGTVYDLQFFNDCQLYAAGNFSVINTTKTGALAWCNPYTSSLITLDVAAVDTLCNSSLPVNLSGGSPAGGSYSGAGVSGTIFDPAVAGPGIHNITYTYDDGNGCVNSASSPVYVGLCTGVSNYTETAQRMIIYPNPANDRIHVNLASGTEQFQNANVYDLSGRLVVSIPFADEIDVSGIPAGAYLLQLRGETGGELKSCLFIKL